MKYYGSIFLFLFFVGCAKGNVNVLDSDGNIVGNCSANFKFHPYGVKDSVNYILYLCAKEHIDKGYKISDESILEIDYSLPPPPEGKKWSKKLAKDQFDKGFITEEKLGYILAEVEYRYWEKLKEAKRDLSNLIITESEYEDIVSKAKSEFEG